jgi:hypothetical protein
MHKFYKKIMLRLNIKKGTVEYIELDLSKHTILTHPDDDVDLAATLIYPPQDHFDYLYILETISQIAIFLSRRISAKDQGPFLQDC